jgi:hypothetical protein
MAADVKLQNYFLLFLSVLFLYEGPLFSQAKEQQIRMVDTINTSLDLFEELDPMHITLTFDLKKYQRNKHKGEYMPVHFLYEINDTLKLEKSMRMKARGKFRRNHCSLAPFWLNIRKTDLMNKHLQDVKRIKIVTHCKGAKAYEEYVLKEFLAYKIYNILSPVSFRVRLLRMTYVDTGRKNKISEAWAFMIEPEDMLAERVGALVVKKDNLSGSLMRPQEMDLVAQFQFMIGNADYSVSGRHNLKILGMPGFGSEGYTPVPYDFDYSGMVNAYYAVPGENLGIKSVRERYYLGPCREDEAFITATEHILQYKEDIFSLVNDFTQLDQKYKKEVLSYLEEYFAQARSFDELGYSLKRTCR